MKMDIDDEVMVALIDLAQVDGVSTTERVDAILRHYLADLHGRLAPAAASVAAVVTGQGLHRETLEGPLWPCVLCGAAEGAPCDAYVHGLATSVAEHAVEHRDGGTSGFAHLPEVPETGSVDPTGDEAAPDVPQHDGTAPEDHPDQEDDHADPVTAQHTAHDDASGDGEGAGVADPAPEADEHAYACSCGRDFPTPQGLGGHCAKTGHERIPGPDKPERTCDVDGCTKPHRARGMCITHHGRWRSGALPAAPDGTPSPADAAPPKPAAKTTAKRTPQPPVKFKVGGCTRCRKPSARLTPVPDVGDLCTVCVKDVA